MTVFLHFERPSDLRHCVRHKAERRALATEGEVLELLEKGLGRTLA
jgi:hypothetical protein